MARSHSLRIVSSGTLFLTHTLTLPTHPTPNTVLRAQAVSRSRGGAASTCLSILAQFPAVQAMLVAPLGGNEEGKMVIRDLEHERVSIRFCKVWDNAGVPSAWVLHADDTGTRTVINNNPLPDITHEEFVSLLGPLLVPENYLNTSPPATSSTNLPRASLSTAPNLNSPAPMDWLHFEGRSVKTTLSNMIGLDASPANANGGATVSSASTSDASHARA
ncbi:hypothetical protein EW026_g8452 [Hermanssonia centrifuga]|uniref:Carbohydrate kinase PfkB domain-containing protein n=1 Tax=Hermanssonia centrifuga TaxID=98765 RepID=A0A4S4K450_9APHY|nr:hypothetical protein EW026_g8452 [Hermanssonia centrifuga]